MTARHVLLFTLGGTIAMAGTAPGASGGVVARLGGADLVSGLAGMDDVMVETHDVAKVSSANLTFDMVLDVVDAAAVAVAGGFDGIVLTQGTDTLEETAFLIDAVWRLDAPFVITGAMRNPTLAGPDGPANLLAAVQVAASASARDLGALVVFNDEIHAARFVRKTHSTSPAAFASPDLGPLGHMVEGVPRILGRAARRPELPEIPRAALAATRVDLYTMTFDDDGGWLRSVEPRPGTGLVVAAFGAGHVPEATLPVLSDLATSIPVVLTSRTGAGSTLTATYGAPGSERDLLGRGLIGGGFLHPYQAKILLRLLLAAGSSRARIADAFRAWG